MSDVWVCGQYMRHEGGSVSLIAATRDVAMAWIQAEHAKAVEGAADMNDFEGVRGLPRDWAVSEIAEAPDSVTFEDNLYIWCAKLTPVASSFDALLVAY